ncbi:MAG TPA: hypothetical protein VD906_01050 [Caulobacteraceae bacterium]|nr:hypothetical protein [Caulobacteraceae bacterium]
MVIRVWRTGLMPAQTAAYDAFVEEHSLPMFRALDGCLGALFLRSETHGLVVSFWTTADAIAALEHAQRYAATVKAIQAAGFLDDPQTVDCTDLKGGFLGEGVIAALAALSQAPGAAGAEPGQ